MPGNDLLHHARRQGLLLLHACRASCSTPSSRLLLHHCPHPPLQPCNHRAADLWGLIRALNLSLSLVSTKLDACKRLGWQKRNALRAAQHQLSTTRAQLAALQENDVRETR